MWIALCAVIGLGLLLAGLAPAHEQNSNGTMSGNSNSNMGGNMNGMNHDMAKSSDMKFMTMAAQGGMAEVAMARYAVDHATSDTVKQYAQRMIDDHTRANGELMQLATTKGITLPTTADPKHQQMMDKMMRLTGADFDREYIKQAGVKAHSEMEKLFTSESNKGRDADAKAFAARTLPTVQEHLRMARDMSGSMMNMKHGGNSNTNSNMNSNSNSNNSNR
jgi:putative membrane protein